MNLNTDFHSGFVALIGRPNVGKSTLMNALLGEKISIVSHHAQTTRNKITGVWNGDHSQVVFLDTPGMHKPQSKLGEVIRQNTMDALDEVDMIVFLCACDDPLGAGDRYILSLLKDRKVPVILALSKIDLISKEELLKKLVQYSKIFKFAEIVPISSKTGENLDTLMQMVVKYLISQNEILCRKLSVKNCFFGRGTKYLMPLAYLLKNSMNGKMVKSISAAPFMWKESPRNELLLAKKA